MPLRLVQITDTHLFADPSDTLKGVATQASLDTVIDTCRIEHPTPDLILLTGDLSQDGSNATYRRIAHACEPLSAPLLAIPGNHDDISAMRHCGLGHERQRLLQGWNIVMLNTAVSGEEWGHLAEKELAFLDEALARHPERSALIGLHHPPVAVGSRWIDAIGLKNGDAFFEVTDRHPQVRVILFGHIHQAFTAKRKGVVLLGTPATCIQFKPHADAFCLDTSQPGYRWLELFPDGRVTTDVVRTT